eukprot:Colp12_sorted_trinity150504_noHs@11860
MEGKSWDFVSNSFGIDSGLKSALTAILHSIKQIASEIRTASVAHAGTQNLSGDHQLLVDLVADHLIFDNLKSSGSVATAASEENPQEVPIGGEGYSVAFDPLDGSSVVDANFAVGSIFGVWPGSKLIGRKGSEQVASVVALYGPRATAVVAIRPNHVIELTLADSEWLVSRGSLQVAPEGKIFAPGNLRATADNPNYNRLVNYWIQNKYTLRYTGAMVPDCYHILIKGKGVFCTPPGKSSKVKLRLLYECAPLALIMTLAGGRATTGLEDILELVVEHMDQRTPVCMGSAAEVQRFLDYRAAEPEAHVSA